MTYTITNNAQFNSIEIAFDGKPSEAVRNALKELRFRWHRVKKVWYGYTNAETAAKAIEDAEKPLEIPESEFVDGYGMYDGWKGGNYSTWSDSKELKALLLADFKRAGIKATVRFERGGFTRAIIVTVTMPKSMIRPIDEYEYRPKAGCWEYYTDENGKLQSIYGEQFFSMSREEQDKLLPNMKETAYRLAIEHVSASNTSSRYEKGILTAEGQKILDTVKAIVTSYNKDCTNSMIDYFDRAIYDSYGIKFV